MNPRRVRRLSVLGLLVALALAAWFLGLSGFIQYASILPPAGPVKKLDAVVALTGGSNRLDVGFDLLEKGFGKKLFISGVYRGIDVKRLLNRWKAEPQSDLDCCVVLGFAADNTAGNAVESVEWLRRENFHSLYLVTANYHMARALLEFRALAPDIEIIPYPVVPDRIVMNKWWSDSLTRNLILREYAKYIATSVWHQVKRFS